MIKAEPLFGVEAFVPESVTEITEHHAILPCVPSFHFAAACLLVREVNESREYKEGTSWKLSEFRVRKSQMWNDYSIPWSRYLTVLFDEYVGT